MSINIDFDKYFAAGEIMNPEYERLKKYVNRILEKEFSAIKYPGGFYESQVYNDIKYIHVSVSTLPVLGKRIQKMGFNKKNNDYEKRIIEFYEKYGPLSEKFKRLKDIVKKVTEKRAEVKETKQREFALACEIDPLTKALIVYHDDFVKAAMEFAADSYVRTKKYLEENGGIEKVAPYPSSNIGSRELYMQAMEMRQYYEEFVRYSRDEYINLAKKDAHAEYVSWIHKMAAKIGKKTVEAKMVGNRADVSPWQSSDLIVKTEDGETQKWYTQRIINRSKYGKSFYQFPSRRYV